MAPAPKREKLLESLYLEPAQAAALKRLAKETSLPKAVLLRKAVDDLLGKQGIEWMRERAKDSRPRKTRRAKLVKPAKRK
jgi:Ribbon-helix-helix domain